jgi:hypothetical protein
LRRRRSSIIWIGKRQGDFKKALADLEKRLAIEAFRRALVFGQQLRFVGKRADMAAGFSQREDAHDGLRKARVWDTGDSLPTTVVYDSPAVAANGLLARA